MSNKPVIIGSRKSDLARLQAYRVGNALLKKSPTLQIQYDFRESLGDINLSDPLWKMPEKGVFTADFSQALLEGKYDLVVHSWKDLPTEIDPALPVRGVLEREDPRDLLLIKKSSLDEIRAKKSLKIFSSSPRRIFCLEQSVRALIPFPVSTLETLSVRGNVPTRFRKLQDDSKVHGMVMAKAALDRLLTAHEEEFQSTRNFLQDCLREMQWMVLPLTLFPSAPAQGALAVQYLASNGSIAELVDSIGNAEVQNTVDLERVRLRERGGGCHQKLGCTIVSLPMIGAVEFFRAEGEEQKPEPVSVDWHSSAWSKLKRRSPLPYDLQKVQRAGILLVSKAEALPKDYLPAASQIVWAAGCETWKKLAERGVWVHGCADRLGLTMPAISALAPDSGPLLNLTHSGAVRDSGDLPTYSLQWDHSPLPLPESERRIFLSSTDDLDMLLRSCSVAQLLTKEIFVGLGETFKAAKIRLPKEVKLIPVWSAKVRAR